MNITHLIKILVASIFLLNCCKPKNSIKLTHCDNLITDTLGTNDSGRIYLPNAFTPNGDGVNDLFIPITVHISSIDFTIYDEMNNILFHTNTLGEGWANSPSPSNNTKYYFRIQAITSDNHKIGICGEVNSLKCISTGMSLNNFLFPDQLSPDGMIYPTNENVISCP